MIDFTKFVHPGDKILQRTSIKKAQTVYRWYEEVARRQMPERFLEIGVGAGYSSYAILSGCRSNLPSLVTWIDFCEGKYHPDGHRNYALGLIRGSFDVKLDDRYIDSHELQDLDYEYDLISIDGDHTTSGCLHDLRVVGRYLSEDGHIICHDAHDRTVRDAIDTFCAESSGGFVRLPFYELYQGCVIIHRADEHLNKCPMLTLTQFVQNMNNGWW